MVRTHIGYGSPVQDTREAHGEALGEKNTRLTKEKLGWPTSPTFLIPPEAASEFARVREPGHIDRGTMVGAVGEVPLGRYPQEAKTSGACGRASSRTARPTGLPMFYPKDGDVARPGMHPPNCSRSWPPACRRCSEGEPTWLPPRKRCFPGMGDMGIGRGYGRNIHFGVRENAMVGMVNGMALHGGVLPYGASFLAFSDYARPALRIAAIRQSPTIIVFTHNSIGLAGEDGPTHQPIEQLGSLRLIRNDRRPPRRTLMRRGKHGSSPFDITVRCFSCSVDKSSLCSTRPDFSWCQTASPRAPTLHQNRPRAGPTSFLPQQAPRSSWPWSSHCTSEPRRGRSRGFDSLHGGL